MAHTLRLCAYECFCECVRRKKWTRWAGVCCTVPHSRNTGSFFSSLLLHSVDFVRFFFSRISFQVILLLNCIFDRCVVFFPSLLFVTVQLSNIHKISFTFRISLQCVWIVDMETAILPDRWRCTIETINKRKYTKQFRLHACGGNPNATRIVHSQMGSRTRKSSVCDVIRYFTNFKMENHHSRLNERCIQYPVDFGFSENVKLKARVRSAHSIQELIYRIWKKKNIYGVLAKGKLYTLI